MNTLDKNKLTITTLKDDKARLTKEINRLVAENKNLMDEFTALNEELGEIIDHAKEVRFEMLQNNDDDGK